MTASSEIFSRKLAGFAAYLRKQGMPDELIARARSLYSAAPDSVPGRMEIDFISEVYL